MVQLATGIIYCAVFGLLAFVGASNEPSDVSRFMYEYKVLERLVRLEQENAELRERVSQLETNRSAHVTVKVRLLANQDVGSSRVRYNVEMWNIGNAYDLDKAEFVTPISGTYIIAVQACLNSGGQWVDLDVIKDGATIGRVFSGDHAYHSCGTETTSVHLNEGNKIWVNRVAGSASVMNQDHGWNTFTAVLVRAD